MGKGLNRYFSKEDMKKIWKDMKMPNKPMKRCLKFLVIQFSSVAQSCPNLCDPMNRSTPGLPVHHQLPEFTQTQVYRVGDAIQPSHPLSSPSPPAPNPSQHQGLFQWVNSSHQVAQVLEFQLQYQSFQWTLEMQIKTTMKYFFTSIKMTITKKTDNNKFWWGCREIGTFTQCW